MTEAVLSVAARDAEHGSRGARARGERRRHADPAGGAVLAARGTAGQRLVEEAPVGTSHRLAADLPPGGTGIAQAIGGGLVLVREGGPVFRANEAFTSSQLAPRHPVTAVGQLADGRLCLS